MKNSCGKHSQAGELPAAATFCWGEAAIWLIVSVLVGLAAGWIATLVAVRFAPLLVFPLAVGVAIGVVLMGVSRFLQSGHRQTILAAAVGASLVAVGAQHYFSYLDAAREIEESKTFNDARAVFAEIMQERLPSGPFDYLRQQAVVGRPLPMGYVARGLMAWLSWGVDGLLLAAGTMGVVVFTVGSKKTEGNEGSKEEVKVEGNGI